MENIKSLLNKLLDFIYKKKCYFCNKSKECVKMCSACYQELTHNDIKENRELLGVKIYSAGVYEKNLQKMIRGIKYHRQKELAYYMAKFMWEYFSNVMEKYNIEPSFQVVPIPLHKNRQKQRGYNHMELVASEFCNLSGLEPNFELVKRIKATKPQYKLPYTKKMENLKGAFSVDKTKLIKGKPVLIIDDICTSGATFTSIISELQANDIKDIICFAASCP